MSDLFIDVRKLRRAFEHLGHVVSMWLTLKCKCITSWVAYLLFRQGDTGGCLSLGISGNGKLNKVGTRRKIDHIGYRVEWYIFWQVSILLSPCIYWRMSPRLTALLLVPLLLLRNSVIVNSKISFLFDNDLRLNFYYSIFSWS